MKTIPLLLLSLLHCTLLHAQPNQKPKPNDFIFELTHINQPDADIYVISQDNVKKFSEWQNPPVTYWGPSKNGVDGSLTYKFPLNQPTEKIHLVANLASFNFAFGRGSGTGQSSLWASKDGKNWTLLLDNPVPDRVDSYKTFDSDLPKELLGGNEIWIQIRLRTEGAPIGSYATAQFARSSANSIEPVFYISTRDKPPKRASEPADTQQPKPAQPAAQKFDLNDLIGDNLIDANGNPVNPATLKNKFIGIYFSAHWCGPCRQFTPKLVEFRNQIADEFEVVFASADQDAPAMLSYMKEAAMPWPALPFASPKISSLNRVFQIRSIPTFVVLDPTGRLASPNARNDVTTLSPKDALSKWKIDAEKAAPPKPALVPPPILSSTSENPPKDTSIVPGKSLLGCPIGSTEEEVVKKLGKPMANFRFGENATALLYYNGTALLRFLDGKLEDGKFSVSSQLHVSHFYRTENHTYSLHNGISIGTTLQKAKEILADQIDIKNNEYLHAVSYIDGGFLIKFKCTWRSDQKNRSDLNSYTINFIEIEKPISPVALRNINPAKSIFNCPLGATESQIVNSLGEPDGKLDLGPDRIGLLYDNTRSLLILWDGVLGGGVFNAQPMLQGTYHDSSKSTLSLLNGITLGASLAKAKKILGEKFDASKSLHNITFQEGDSLVTIHSYSRTPNGVSHEEAAKDINNYTIHSIQIDPISKAQPVSPSTGCAIPKKTTFPARQNPEAFHPADMVAVEGGTLSEKSNLPGVKVDSFFIGKYEVTNAEWLAIQAFAQMNGYSFSKDPRTDHPEMPVEGVTRREAMLWCNAKSEKEGRKPVYWLNGKVYKSPDQEPEMNLDADGYRLPTEPEWEWAARGGIQSKGYEFSGSNIQNEVAWHGDDGEKWARLVGTKKPNELGIHDMSGNVYEWVWDINIPTHGIQGGSYMSGKWHLILNHRNSSPLRDFANEVGSARSLGFRVARNHSKETKPPITPVSYQTIPDHSASGPEQPTVPKVDLLSLIGKELINAAGEPVDPNTLQNKMIALYFSAHWCGPCQGFTPKLVDLANKHKDDLTVVFLSSDKSAEAMLTYMNESKMPWPAIPFESENIQKLKDVLKVKSIPTLVILNPSGNLLTADGRNDVGKLTPEKCIAKWKSSQPLELSKLSKIQAPPIFQRSPPPRPKDITIDPGKSIFGCAYGSSEDDVINKLGTPLGRSEFESGVTGLIYGIDCLLYLKNGGLVGASLNHDSNYAILNRFSYSSPQQYFNNISTGGWRLSNGIHPKMAFQDAKKILGSQIALNEANPQFEINNQVIMFSSSNRNNFHLIESLTILPKELKEGIKLKQQSSELEITTINPGRIFLGCKWGSGPQEIIQTLGNPNAIFDLGENKKGYSYKNNLLILWDEKLAGCHLTNPGSLTLPNGVRLGMPLQEAITIIGDKLINPNKNKFSEISYTDGSLLFTVKSIKIYKPEDWSRIFESQQNPQSFVVESIQIDPIAKSIN